MNKVVLDSSALLAFINQEEGCLMVEEYLAHSIMSSINISEVEADLSLIEMPEDTIKNIIDELNIEIIDFDQDQAIDTGFFRKKSKHAGLSLGDRACINLGTIKNLLVVTADKAWKKLKLNEKIVFIR